jgi:hypothetical protein
MRKIITAVFAAALGLALAAPLASACPGMDKTAKQKDESGVIAQDGDDKAGDGKKAEEAPKKAEKQQPKLAKATPKKQKKPVRVSQK